MEGSVIYCISCKEKPSVNGTLCECCRTKHRQAIKEREADRGTPGSRLWCKIGAHDESDNT